MRLRDGRGAGIGDCDGELFSRQQLERCLLQWGPWSRTCTKMHLLAKPSSRFPLPLSNSPPFTSFRQWFRAQDLPWDGPLLPQMVSAQQRQWQRNAEGPHRAALLPILPFGLHPDEHFDLARDLAHCPTPFEAESVLDLDLQFAAEVTAAGRGTLPAVAADRRGGAWRAEAQVGWGRRLFAAGQEPRVRRVTARRDIGFLALLLLLVGWGGLVVTPGFH